MRVPTDGQTHRQTDRHTDANRFYNLSHAICYSYGADNEEACGDRYSYGTDNDNRQHANRNDKASLALTVAPVKKEKKKTTVAKFVDV